MIALKKAAIISPNRKKTGLSFLMSYEPSIVGCPNANMVIPSSLHPEILIQVHFCLGNIILINIRLRLIYHMQLAVAVINTCCIV